MPAGVPLDGIAGRVGPARGGERAAAGSARRVRALWVLVLGVSLVGLVALYDRSFISIDGAFYVSAAQNLASGHGFATSIIWNEEQYRAGGMPAPQTVFPPGYPLLIAVVSRLGVDPPYAAFLVALLAFGAIPLVIYDILRAAGHPPLRAFAVSAVWLGAPFAWFNVLSCMSEMLFTLLTLLSLRCVMQSDRDPGRRDLWLAAAGTVAGLAFTVRYQGVYYLISLGLFFLLRVTRARDRQSVRALMLVAGPASVFVVALFVRNHLLIGKLVTLIPEDRSLLDVLRTFAWGLGELLGFTRSGLLDGLPLVRLTPSRAWHARAVRLWWGVAALALVAGQVNVFHHHWRLLHQANPYRTMADALQRPVANESLLQFLRDRVTTASPLLGNEAQLLGAVLDRPVLGLPRAGYTRKVWTDDQVRGLVAAYGVDYVVFFPGLFNPSDPQDRNRPFFRELTRGSVPPWLVAILLARDVRLYRVDRAAIAGSSSDLGHARRGGRCISTFCSSGSAQITPATRWSGATRFSGTAFSLTPSLAGAAPSPTPRSRPAPSSAWKATSRPTRSRSSWP